MVYNFRFKSGLGGPKKLMKKIMEISGVEMEVIQYRNKMCLVRFNSEEDWKECVRNIKKHGLEEVLDLEPARKAYGVTKFDLVN